MTLSIMQPQELRACFSTMDGLDVGHAAQVRLDNMPDAVWEQHAVKVLTEPRGSMALNPYLCPCG